MKCRLTKIRSTHNNLRRPEYVGETLCIPTVGMGFVMDYGPAPFRVMTTPVQAVERMENEFMFHTENSTYKLELLDETTEAVLCATKANS